MCVWTLYHESKSSNSDCIYIHLSSFHKQRFICGFEITQYALHIVVILTTFEALVNFRYAFPKKDSVLTIIKLFHAESRTGHKTLI